MREAPKSHGLVNIVYILQDTLKDKLDINCDVLSYVTTDAIRTAILKISYINFCYGFPINV